MFWVISLFTYSTKHFPSNSILLHFFFNGWEKLLTSSKNFSPQQKWWKRRRIKFHVFNKKNFFILLRYAHSLLHFTQLLCYTFYDYILFVIIFIHLSFLISFLYKFILLFFADFFFSSLFHSPGMFSCQYYASTDLNILCNFFVFDLLSFILFEPLLTFFFRGSRERKSRAREKTMKITRGCLCLDTQVKVMISWFSWTLLKMKITSATPNTTSPHR